MILIIIKVGNFVLSSSQYYKWFEKLYKTLERLFHPISKHLEAGKKKNKIRCASFFSTHFSEFGNSMKHSPSLLIYNFQNCKQLLYALSLLHSNT